MNKKVIIASVGIVLIALVIGGLFNYSNLFSSAAIKEDKQQALFAAIKEDNLAEVERLVVTEKTPQKPNTEKLTPFEYALMYQNYQIATFLLKHEGSVNPQSKTPLYVAMVFSLNSYEQQPQDDAFKKTKLKMFDSAYKYHKNQLMKTNERGNTALQIAALKGDVDIVSWLLEKGIDPEHANKEEETAMYIAVQEGYFDVVSILHEANDELVKVKDKDKNTLLTIAAMSDRREIVNMLWPYLSDAINEQNSFGKTALIYASEYGYTELVKVLVEQGADQSLKSQEGLTAKQYATNWNHKDIVAILK